MKFLTARWEHLLLANYCVDSDVLEPHVPRGTRLDAFEGKWFVSLVAFMFNRTRVLGIPVPFHRDFEEVNLRFYVAPEKDPTIRAVTFLKEIVPKRVIPWISNSLFNENYVALPMDHHNGSAQHWYSWSSRSLRKTAMRAPDTTAVSTPLEGLPDRSRNHIFAAELGGTLAVPSPGTVGEFITEHYWGYAQGRRATLEYRVEHPPWECVEVTRYQIDVDFGAVYGESFAFLNNQSPYNVLYARGSDVSVSFPSRYCH